MFSWSVWEYTSDLFLFTAVRGESGRAQAQQSDGDRGGHEENQGKMKTQCHVCLRAHTPQSCGDLI